MIIVDLLGKVRACQEQVTLDEAAVTASRAELAGYTALLAYAEAHADPTPSAELVAEDRATHGPGWCDCGLPGTPGVVHGIGRCEVGEPGPTPSLPRPYTERAPFQPYTPTSVTKQGETS
ncbi:hypothetical protein ACQPYK_08715 [Streptosporangium sp. CA-135522]|uniref:hypothetical protein n=1 Tax=Streptosporangium sp. CA-135522 TaxID=3240072 RepID=UPI003D8CC36B